MSKCTNLPLQRHRSLFFLVAHNLSYCFLWCLVTVAIHVHVTYFVKHGAFFFVKHTFFICKVLPIFCRRFCDVMKNTKKIINSMSRKSMALVWDQKIEQFININIRCFLSNIITNFFFTMANFVPS